MPSPSPSPSLLAAAGAAGFVLDLCAFLEARDVARLRRAARLFSGARVRHLRVRNGLVDGALLAAHRSLLLLTVELKRCRLQADALPAIGRALSAMGALASCDLGGCRLGQLVLPAGWTQQGRGSRTIYRHEDGRRQAEHPGEPEGAVAVAGALPAMGALARLAVDNNRLGAEGARRIAAALPECR